MTSSPSRAWVQSDWSVYIALPSAWRLITGRSGTRDRRAGRERHAHADRAAGERQPVVPRRAGGRAGGPEAAGLRLVGDDRALGEQRADARRRSSRRVSGPVGGRAGPRAASRAAPALRRAGVGEPFERVAPRRPGPVREHVDLAVVGHERARLARDTRRTTPAPSRADEHEVAVPASCGRSRTRRGSRAARVAGCPAPRSSRAGNVSPSTFAPVVRRDRGSAARARSRAARRRRGGAPPVRPTASALAATATASSLTGFGAASGARSGRRPAPSSHDTSAGSISVATCARGLPRRGDGLRRVVADVGGALDVRTQPETLPRRALDVRPRAARRTGGGRWRGRRRC